jgi:hypothetical protein
LEKLPATVFLSGVVTDGSKLLLGVSVEVLDTDNRQLASTSTNSIGEFELKINQGGELTGGNITSALPACNPRIGPMYLAYYDAPTNVDVTVNGIVTARIQQQTFVRAEFDSRLEITKVP